VKKTGPNPKTWKRLCKLLNRKKTSSVRYRHLTLTSATESGTWTLQEDEIMLKHFFAGKSDCTAQDIKNISIYDLKSLATQLNRQKKTV
jgi:hypothetical protein